MRSATAAHSSSGCSTPGTSGSGSGRSDLEDETTTTTNDLRSGDPAQALLDIIVVWHPGDREGGTAFDALHDHFHSATYSGLAGGAVEVYSRSTSSSGSYGGAPRSIALPADAAPTDSVAQYTVVVLCQGTSLSQATSSPRPWRDYVIDIWERLAAARSAGQAQLIPVHLPGYAPDSRSWLTRQTGAPQAIRDLDSSCTDAGPQVAQSIVQWLLDPEGKGKRLTVFISHTKRAEPIPIDQGESVPWEDRGGLTGPDGARAEELQQLIECVRTEVRSTRLAEFFDAHDIQTTEDSSLRMLKEAASSALLMVRTDQYSSREWTQQEVLSAKQHDCPIVCLSALSAEERRGSFLMDHVPTIALDRERKESSIRRALGRLVDEALKNALWNRQQVYRESGGFDWLPSRAPEPVTMIHRFHPFATTGVSDPSEHGPLTDEVPRAEENDPRSAKAREELWVLHPDPPLGPAELSTMTALGRLTGTPGRIEFLTPRTFTARGGRVGVEQWNPPSVSARALAGTTVGLSVSESTDLPRLGLSPRHLDLIVAELAHAIFNAGGTVIYGGDLRSGGFTHIIADEAKRRFGGTPVAEFVLSRRALRSASWSDLIDFRHHAGEASTVHLAHECGRTIPLTEFSEDEFLSWQSVKVDAFDDLRDLRSALTTRCKARVVVGGKTEGYSGDLPGVIDEASRTVADGSPLYAAGGYGGAAQLIANAIGSETGPDLLDEQGAITTALRGIRDSAVPDGLDRTERDLLHRSHRPGDIATLAVLGLSRTLGG